MHSTCKSVPVRPRDLAHPIFIGRKSCVPVGCRSLFTCAGGRVCAIRLQFNRTSWLLEDPQVGFPLTCMIDIGGVATDSLSNVFPYMLRVQQGDAPSGKPLRGR